MKFIANSVVGLLIVGCSVNEQCEKEILALRSVKADSDGYFPRDAVFEAAGIDGINQNPFVMTSDAGSASLECGGWLAFKARGYQEPPMAKTIDEKIMPNPNRTAMDTIRQLESVVVIDKRSRERFRLEAVHPRPR